MKRRLALLTSGGDAPGMNAALRAATLVALDLGWEVFGVHQGYKGLIEGDFRPLNTEIVGDLVREGGTFLGSARCLEFLEQSGRDQARAQLAKAGIDALIVIGGNGSLTGASALADPAELGDQVLSVIGLPASIDNDVGLTSISIGVDTALNTIVEACDKISDTASAHDRTFIVEVMGRDCGYLAMASSISVGAEAVLFRESGLSAEETVREVTDAILVAHRRPGDQRRVMVIMSEGMKMPAQELKERVQEQLIEIGGELADTEIRVTVLGHIVRGGRPSAFDRMMASRLGFNAVRALDAGHTRKMVAWNPPRFIVPESAQKSSVDPRCWLIGFEEVLEETRRLSDGTSPVIQWRTRIFEDIEDVLRH